MKKIILIVGLLISNSTFASFTKGNGGNALICEGQASGIILDYYEATEVLGFSIDAKLESQFDRIILDRLIGLGNRFDNLAARQFAENFKIHLDQFSRQNIWISGASLGEVNDSYHLAIPSHCTLEQAAVQSTSRYFLQADIWYNLTEFQKNTLRLHELIYRTLLSRQVLLDSRPVRALVGLLLSQEFSQMTLVEITQFFKTHQIKLN